MKLFVEEDDVEKKSTPTEAKLSFDEFWSLYPRKVAKEMAWRAWERLSPDAQRACLDSIRKWRRVWTMDGQDTRFLPHAATWLNQSRWTDEVPEPISHRPTSASHVIHQPPPEAEPPRTPMPDEVRVALAELMKKKVTRG